MSQEDTQTDTTEPKMNVVKDRTVLQVTARCEAVRLALTDLSVDLKGLHCSQV